MKLWVWRGIRIEVPDDWEMLLFSREARAGRCAFADRYQFRLEFSWRQGNARPDMERMLSDYLGKLRLEGTVPDAREVRNGPFRGIEGRQEGIPTSRFGLYLERLGCLVELVFLWPEARDADLERAVLGSIEPELPWAQGLQHWRAFGLDVLTPGSLTLSECRNEPANAALTFTSPRSQTTERFMRLGLVEEWLEWPIEQWLRSRTPRDATITAVEATSEGGHERVVLTGRRRPGFLRKAAPYVATAWRCPADGRLYAMTSCGSDAPSLGHRLSCCSEMELRA